MRTRIIRTRLTDSEYNQVMRVAKIKNIPFCLAVGYHIKRVIEVDGLAPDIEKLDRVRAALVRAGYAD